MPGAMLVTLSLIIWLACVIGVAKDARRQGVRPLFWTLVTLVSGPLGLADYLSAREHTIGDDQGLNPGSRGTVLQQDR